MVNKWLLVISIISTILGVITRYVFGKDASGDILMWLFVLAIVSLVIGIWKD